MCPDIQVIMVFKGTLEITWNLLGEEVIIIAPERSVVSVPANSWRRYRAVGDDVEFILTAEGDQRKRVYWAKRTTAVLILTATSARWILCR
ncbi:hypothetical protein [Leclercia sp. UBA2479]|uniref:hypothetical protein n=1 Tax=Leclercia sp. UBA2479 TaxID=1946738 RepID=UPI00257CC743|nr:hypothetical protein [Leclercia sp. UBA2479]